MREAYRYWVLDCFAGQPQGKAPIEMVYAYVERNLGRHFTAREKADVPSGPELTWKNDVRQERRNMIKDGLLGAHSPRSIWEITDAGRVWLKHHPESGSPGWFREEL